MNYKDNQEIKLYNIYKIYQQKNGVIKMSKYQLQKHLFQTVHLTINQYLKVIKFIMNKQNVHANSDEDQLDPTLSQDASFFNPIYKSKKIKQQSFCGLFFHWLFQIVQKTERRITNEGSVFPRNFISNKINNQKYSLFTFIPKFLYNEYKYFSNLYFLLLALSQFYPPFKIGFLITYVGPIVVILFLSFMKELLDEIQRIRKDKKYNKEKYIKIQFNNQIYIKSQDICVGDLLIIKKDQRVPADLILLKTTDKDGAVYVRTDQLDGETDWKTRDAIKFTQNLENYQDIYSYQWKIEIESPNDQIYKFAGSFQGSTVDELESIRINNTIWANMRVASGEILGVVIYTGKETRIAQNSRKPISKRGKTDNEINKLSKLLLFSLVLIAIFLSMVSGRLFQEGWLFYLVRAFILLSAIIPISMKVNLDFAKLMYSHWINKDKDIQGTITRNSNIPEELGRIEILLSDKTGTLTKNEMIFKQLKTPFEIIQNQNLNNFVQQLHNIENNILNNHILTEKQLLQYQLIRCLSLCHNVWPVGQDEDRTLQASSPDEIALVNFIESLNIKLHERKTNEITLKNQNDDYESFQILYNFPFSSERKRMGILVKDLQTNRYYFYLKGADIVIRKKVSDEDRLFVDEECYNLSIEGLRTLALSYKEITQEQFQNFDNQMKQAGQNLQKRDLLERKAISQLEKNMKILGISGVEDLLQENLKSSIVTLKEAGIKVWMLTGDKMETAKCIAISTGFKNHQQQFLELNQKNLKDIEKVLENYNPIQHTLVITGSTLEIIFQDYYLIQQFFKKCIESQNVVLCRCAPKQKALVAYYLKNIYHKIVCCIGDGGNDVAMIQTGNIGIGIEGKEGMQAALSSDFSVVKFSYILKLFLWHGRLSYIRTCTLSNFVIQRGLIIAFIQVFFTITFYYVSINIYNGYLTFCYSTIFTNFPVFALIWDRDIPLSQILNYPTLYYMVQKGKNLNEKVFLFLIWKSFYQAAIIFLLTIMIFDNSFTKIVTITFSILIIIQYLNICNNINTWHTIIFVSIILSLITYLICFLFLKNLFLIGGVDLQGYLYICFIAFCAWGPFFIFKYLEKLFAPTQIDKVIRESKMLKKRRKEGILNIKSSDQFNQQILYEQIVLFKFKQQC